MASATIPPTPTAIASAMKQVLAGNQGHIDIRVFNKAYFQNQLDESFLTRLALKIGLVQLNPREFIDPNYSQPLPASGGMIPSVQGLPGTWIYDSSTTPVTSAIARPPQRKNAKRKFKDGDKVKVLENDEGVPRGTIGTIVGYENPRYLLDNGITPGVYFHISTKYLTPLVPKRKPITLESVVIEQEKKEEIQAAISQVKNDEQIFSKWGFSDVFEKGTAVSLLFWGIPGTGKTLTAQAIADELGAELKLYSTAEIQSSEPGGAERTIKEIFAKASEQNKTGTPTIILFDECDSLLTDRNEVGPILGAQVNALLSEIERYSGIVIFTTNRMGKLDPALERRLSAKIEFEFPSKMARKQIWKRMIPKNAPIAKDVDFDKLAAHSLAGGNIKNAVLNAARSAAYKKEKEISMNHFVAAIDRESRALEQFIKEYEGQTHPKMVNTIRHGADGSVKVEQKQTVKETLNVRQKISMRGAFAKKKGGMRNG